MNYEKLNTILSIIRSKDLPKDRWGGILNSDDLIVWFNLKDVLEGDELEYIKTKLDDLIETRSALELWNLPRL